jgi:hypothetical protein
MMRPTTQLSRRAFLFSLITVMDVRKRRIRTISVRYPTPSREGIVISVVQRQDAMGRWMVPTITFSQNLQPIIESGRFARDVGMALIVASYFFDEFMTYVQNDEARSNDHE